MRDGNLEGSLIKVIGNSGGKDLLLEAAEFSLDALLKDGVVRDIPIVGAVAKLYSAAVGVQGYMFAKKLRRFLIELSSVPIEERSAFIEKSESDRQSRERLSEVLLTFIDKLDDLEKAPLLARAFSGYLREQYDLPTFQRLATSIDRCFVFDLSRLESMNKPIKLEGYVGDMLVSAGLASIVAIPSIRGGDAKTTYERSHLGDLFLQVVVKGLLRDGVA